MHIVHFIWFQKFERNQNKEKKVFKYFGEIIAGIGKLVEEL